PATCARFSEAPSGLATSRSNASALMLLRRPCRGMRSLRRTAAENALGLGHRLQLAQRHVPWQVVEAARARDDGLLGRQPAVNGDALGNALAGLDVRVLHVD